MSTQYTVQDIVRVSSTNPETKAMLIEENADEWSPCIAYYTKCVEKREFLVLREVYTASVIL